MNIYISNLKNKYIMIYDGQNWTARDKKTELESLYAEKEMLLEQWLEEECYPELKEKFALKITKTGNAIENELHIGYLKLEKII